MQLILGDNQQCVLGPVTAKDKAGNDAPFQNLGWGSSDPTIATANDNGDGTCTVVAQGPLGSCVITAAADADMGEGVVPITATVDVTIQPEQATGLNVAIGTPTEKA